MKSHPAERSEHAMTQEEKGRILTLLGERSRWCQEAEAHDGQGADVRYDDPAASAWDLTGAVCHLFGWDRAMELFQQLARHLAGRKPPTGRHVSQPRDLQIASMAELQDFNDQPMTSHESMITWLTAIPVVQPRGAAVLAITPNASLRLARALAEERAEANMALRMVRKEDNWVFWLDQIRPDDISFTHDGKTVLVLAGELSASLRSCTLDVEETPNGQALSLRVIPPSGHSGQVFPTTGRLASVKTLA
jgi:hypothetical protein